MGFPISVRLNPSYYRWAKIKRFKLFNSNNEEIKAKLITTQK